MSLKKNDKYFKRAKRISSCMDFWVWDKYEKNKILDLKSVNRCMNSRFCPNCRKLDLSKFLYSFKPRFCELLNLGFTPYFLTLTIPNCCFSDLKSSIDLLYKSFSRLWEGFSCKSSSKKAFAFRQVEFVAALKVLEITTNLENKEFHPHLHCIIFLKDFDRKLLIKKYKGLYSTKRNQYDYYSDLDIHFKKIWTLICKNGYISSDLYYNSHFNFSELYQVDFRSFDDQSGLYEVIKYTMKDSDISNQEVFSHLVNALESRRIRQGYGLLYNLKCENVDVGEFQELELEIAEDPIRFYHNGIKELYTTYSEFKKISRYTPNEFYEIVEE